MTSRRESRPDDAAPEDTGSRDLLPFSEVDLGLDLDLDLDLEGPSEE